MRVLVTGATGFVGSHSVRALQTAGHDVRLLVRNGPKANALFPTMGADALVIGDVTDPESVSAALDGVDAVVHCAAVVTMRARRAGEVLDTNLCSVQNVIGGAAARGVQSIVYMSSATALFTPGAPISAESPVGVSRSAYARSKADGEAYVRKLQDSGAPIQTLYPPGIIGPDDPGLSEGNHALNALLSQTMVDTATGFEAVDVRDLAAVVAAFAAAGGSGRHIVSGEYLAWRDVIALFDELTGRRVRRVRVGGRTLRAMGRVGDVVNRVVQFDFPMSRESMEYATLWPGTVQSPGVDALGIDFRGSRQTYADTIRWLYRAGHLTADTAGKLAD